MKNFNTLIYENRKTKKLTQKNLAEHLHITRQYYQMLESGKRQFTKELLYELCEVLEIDFFNSTEVEEELKKLKKKHTEITRR